MHDVAAERQANESSKCMQQVIVIMRINQLFAITAYRMMTSYIKGTARVVNRVPTLRLGQVR